MTKFWNVMNKSKALLIAGILFYCSCLNAQELPTQPQRYYLTESAAIQVISNHYELNHLRQKVYLQTEQIRELQTAVKVLQLQRNLQTRTLAIYQKKERPIPRLFRAFGKTAKIGLLTAVVIGGTILIVK